MLGLRRIASPSGAPFTVGGEHADQFAGLLDDLAMAGYPVQAGQSGGFNPRNIAGTSTPSQHAYGRAIDVNWNDNARGTPGRLDPEMAQGLAAKHGMTWGGGWANPDPMHFEISGKQPVLPKLDLLAADGSNARSGGASGATGGGGQRPMTQPYMPGSPEPQVAGYEARGEQPRSLGLLDDLSGRLQSPLFQQGLGLFLAAAQGKDLNEGLSAGTQRGASMQQTMRTNAELRRQEAQREAIKKLLGDQSAMSGVPPVLARIAQATGDPSPIVQHLSRTNATDDIREYEYALKSGFTGNFQSWMEKKKALGGEYAKQLVFGTNDAGETVPMQAGSRGDLIASKMPDGVKISRDPIKMDAGDSYVLLDPTTRQPIGRIPKNLAEAERQKVSGEAQGKAQADLPAAESHAANLNRYIDLVAKDPYLDRMTGWNGALPNVSEKSRGLQAKIDQLNGQAFLTAFQSLKGAGAITEKEGAAAQRSLTRLQEQLQSDKEYRAALDDFRRETERLLELARQKAGKGSGGANITIRRLD